MCANSLIWASLVCTVCGSAVQTAQWHHRQTKQKAILDAFSPDVQVELERLHSNWIAHPLSALVTLLLTFADPTSSSQIAGYCSACQNAILPVASPGRPKSRLLSALGSWRESQADALQVLRRCSRICMQIKGQNGKEEEDSSGKAKDILKDGANKGVWFAAELFGKAAATVRGSPSSSKAEKGTAPASLEESIARLQADYEGTTEDPRPYFLSGRMDESLYDENCEFADPFVSFKGRQRFKDNLENLAGGFIIDSSTRTLETVIERGDMASGAPPSYTTKLMVKLQLGLPWKPVLAWPWGVKHEFDASSGLIVRHIESWDVSAGEGVRQLLKPGPGRGIGNGRSSVDS